MMIARPLRRRLGLHRARLLLCHGGALTPETANFFAALGLPITEGYGTTETAGWALLSSHGGGGTPISERGWRIGPDGELSILLEDGWLDTGDHAAATADGLCIAGKMGNVQTETIERHLAASPFVRRAVTARVAQGLAAIIEIDPAAVGAWARGNTIAYPSLASLSGLPAVHTLIGVEIRRLAPAADIVFYQLLREPPERATGDLLPAGNARRSALLWQPATGGGIDAVSR
jgi:long-chain acyl-CoA synthetase